MARRLKPIATLSVGLVLAIAAGAAGADRGIEPPGPTAAAAKKKCKKARGRAHGSKKCRRGSGAAPLPIPNPAPPSPAGPPTPAPASLSIAPTSYDFGPVDAFFTPYHTTTFTVTNAGGSASGAISDSVGGANPSKFQITSDGCNGVSLGAGGSCAIVVSYVPGCDPANPSGCQTGGFSATLNVSASPGGALIAPMTGSTFI